MSDLPMGERPLSLSAYIHWIRQRLFAESIVEDWKSQLLAHGYSEGDLLLVEVEALAAHLSHEEARTKNR
jgi:hypothetical protein